MYNPAHLTSALEGSTHWIRVRVNLPTDLDTMNKRPALLEINPDYPVVYPVAQSRTN
jgi:hypothetical protein